MMYTVLSATGEDMDRDQAESVPAAAVDIGGKLGGFFAAAESAPPAGGHTSANWRDRINYAGRRSRAAQLQRRQQPDD